MAANINWYPRQTGTPEVDEGFRRAFDYFYQIRSALARQANTIANLSAPAPLTVDQVQQIKQSLQLGGSSPLNVTGLPGANNSNNVPVVLIIEDTHNNRLANRPANKYPLDSVLLESDTGVFLINENVSNAQTWVPRWAEPLVITGPPFNNSNISPAWWPQGTQAFSNDIEMYWDTQPIVSVCNVNGTQVTQWLSGNNSANGTTFNPAWVQYPCTINNNNYQILSVGNNGTSMTLATPYPGNGNDIVFVMPGALWCYAAGIYTVAYGSRPSPNTSILGMILAYNPPTGSLFGQCRLEQVGISVLPEWTYFTGVGTGNLNDMIALSPTITEVGLQFAQNYSGHVHIWNGNNWEFAKGDPGSNFWAGGGSNAPFGPSTTAIGMNNGWYPCDGNAHNITMGNGNLVSVTVPNINGNVAAIMGGGFNANLVPGTSPKWNANANTGIESADVLVVTVAGTNNVAAANHTHQFATANANAPIYPPSTNNGGLPDHYLISAWWRG